METLELSPKFELKYNIDNKSFVYASATGDTAREATNFQMFSNLIQSQIRTRMMSELMKSMGGGNTRRRNGGRQYRLAPQS